MRIVIDLQTCQSSSRFRGIGRNSLALATEMIPLLEAQGHEVTIFLHSGFPDETVAVRQALAGVGKQIKFAEFCVPTPCTAGNPENTWRQHAAELLREYALVSLEPDYVHMSQLMADGWGDDSIASIGELGVHIPTALTQHDLIPLVLQDIYLPPGDYRDYYLHKLAGLKRADLLLAVSNYSREEVIEQMGVNPDTVISISSAVGDGFRQLSSSRTYEQSLVTLQKFGLQPGYLLYVPGGFDARKNIECLFQAVNSLPVEIRKDHPLVIASKLYPGQRDGLVWQAQNAGLAEADVVLTDFVSDEELVDLYRLCHLYVFPSFHEGFGLPVLEAMVCGAPVIAADCTGVTEAVGMPEALFAPYSFESIASSMFKGITDDAFRQRLKSHAAVHPDTFSWKQSALTAVNAIEASHRRLVSQGWKKVLRHELPDCDELLNRLAASDCPVQPSEDDLQQFRSCYEANQALGKVMAP